MRELRVARIVTQFFVVTASLWVVVALGCVYVVLSGPGDSNLLALVMVAGLLLLWEYRRAVTILAWIERRIWGSGASCADRLALKCTGWWLPPPSQAGGVGGGTFPRRLRVGILVSVVTLVVWPVMMVGFSLAWELFMWTLRWRTNSMINVEPPDLFFIVAITLWLAYRCALPTVSWIERHFWEEPERD